MTSVSRRFRNRTNPVLISACVRPAHTRRNVSIGADTVSGHSVAWVLVSPHLRSAYAARSLARRCRTPQLWLGKYETQGIARQPGDRRAVCNAHPRGAHITCVLTGPRCSSMSLHSRARPASMRCRRPTPPAHACNSTPFAPFRPTAQSVPSAAASSKARAICLRLQSRVTD